MPFDLNRSVAILEQTPTLLDGWLGNLPNNMLITNEGEGTWSPFDILGHLINGEQTDWIPRARIILFEDDKHFTPFDRFAQEQESVGKSMNDLLQEFTSLRAANVTALKSFELNEDNLNKTGIHPEFGEVKLSWHLLLIFHHLK